RALPYHEKALAMQARLAEREMAAAPELQALAFLRSLPRTRDGYLSAALKFPRTTASSCERAWAARSALLRLLLRRQETPGAARPASVDAREKWRQRGEVRRRLSRLLLQPGNDAAARDRLLENLEREQERVERELGKLLPLLQEHKELARLGPKDLAAKLPP